MATIKTIVLASGLITGVGGVASGAAYSAGLFNSNIQISELIKKDNKHILLTSSGNTDDAEWTEAWKKYQSNKVWGEIASESGNTVPTAFKNKCDQKVKETVYDTKDKKYGYIINYCSRDKTIKDVLKEEEFELLDVGQTAEWQNRFDNYKASTNQLKLPEVDIREGDTKEAHHSKLSGGCNSAVNTKTIDKNYVSTLTAVKKWCKAKQ